MLRSNYSVIVRALSEMGPYNPLLHRVVPRLSGNRLLDLLISSTFLWCAPTVSPVSLRMAIAKCQPTIRAYSGLNAGRL